MTSRDFLERYGVTLTIVGILAVVIMLLPGNKPASTTTAIADGTQAASIAGAAGDVPIDGGPGRERSPTPRT